MLRSLGEFVSGLFPASARFPGRWPFAAILCGLAIGQEMVSAQPPILRGPGMEPLATAGMMPIGVPQAPGPLPPSTGVPGLPAAQTRMVQNPGEYDKPLPRQIDRLPNATEKLEVIHRRSQLMVTRQRVMRFAISDPSIIDIIQYSPTELSIVGLGLGSTNLLYWFEGDIEPLIYEVTVVPDPALEEQRRIDYGRLERKLAILFPNSKVYLIPLSGKIIVKGQARDGEEASKILEIVRGEIINQDGRLGGPQPLVTQDQLNAGLGLGAAFDVASTLIVNMLDVPGEYQVMLRVRIAELSRSQLRRMGINLAGLFNDGRHFISSTLGGVGGALTGIFENGEATVLLNWLESNGSAKILSEPTLTVLSGHAASFLSGAEFAVPTIVGIGGAAGQTTTFRGFGTSILVTPTVIDRDLIRMRIVPEFSEANTNLTVGGIPGLNSRRVQTTVELREGQTIAIAGLISHQTNVEVTRIPFFGEIPHIGPLIFNTKRAAQDETELLVLVTPELVRPMDAEEVPPVPGYEVTPPSQWELYHAAMVEGAPDTSYYQVPPLGSDSNHGINVPYRLYSPAPADPQYAPIPNNTFGATPFGSSMDSQPSMQHYGNPGGFIPAPPTAAPNQYYPTNQSNTTWQQGHPGQQRVIPAGYQPAARRTSSNPMSGWFR